MTRKEEIMQAAHDSVLSYRTDVAFIQGAEWADTTMKEKVFKFLSGLTECKVSCIGEDVYGPVLSDKQLEDLKKVMEG